MCPRAAGHRVVDQQRLRVQPYRLGAAPSGRPSSLVAHQASTTFAGPDWVGSCAPANAAPARLAAWSIGRAPPLGSRNRTDRGLDTAPDTRLPSYLCLRNTVNTVVPRTAVPANQHPRKGCSVPEKVQSLAGIEPATPSLPSMRGWFATPRSTLRPHTFTEVRGAAGEGVVGDGEDTCGAVSGKFLARRADRAAPAQRVAGALTMDEPLR
jgi:hypothetical protein